MIVVKVMLWPRGDEAEEREIGRGLIANVGGSDVDGRYEVRLLDPPEIAERRGPWRRGRVEAFARKRLGPWDLVLRALVACCAHRSPVAALGSAEVGDMPLDAEGQREMHSIIEPAPEAEEVAA
jgi:hypothetical protein